MVKIREVTKAEDEVLEALERLVPQLSRSSPPVGETELQEIVADPRTHLLVAEYEGLIVGTLTLVLFRIPTGMRAWIEDVIVDSDGPHRGKGLKVGELLNRRAIEIAQSHGAKTVDLTSRPSREQANAMYQRMGFQQRDTNVYRYGG